MLENKEVVKLGARLVGEMAGVRHERQQDKHLSWLGSRGWGVEAGESWLGSRGWGVVAGESRLGSRGWGVEAGESWLGVVAGESRLGSRGWGVEAGESWLGWTSTWTAKEIERLEEQCGL